MHSFYHLLQTFLLTPDGLHYFSSRCCYFQVGYITQVQNETTAVCAQVVIPQLLTTTSVPPDLNWLPIDLWFTFQLIWGLYSHKESLGNLEVSSRRTLMSLAALILEIILPLILL